MRKIILVLILALSTTSLAYSFDRSKKLDFVTKRGMNLLEVFKELTEISENTIHFNFHDSVDIDRTVVLNVNDVSFEDLLNLILKQYALDFEEISENMYFIFKADSKNYSSKISHIFYFENQNLDTIVTMIKQLYPETLIIKNIEINAIVAKASRLDMKQIAQLVDAYKKRESEEQSNKFEKYYTFNFVSVNAIEPFLRSAYNFEKFVVDKENNSVLLKFNRGELEKIDTIIEKLDKKQDSVLIEVMLIDKRIEKDDKLGFKWDEVITYSADNWNPEVFIPDNFEYTFSSSNANILSKPQILTLNKQPGSTFIGEQFPIVSYVERSDSSSDLVPKIEYFDTGITLNCTPEIHMESQEISLDVSMTISEVGEYLSTDYGSYPTFLNKNSKSKLLVNSGDTIIFSGLISDEEREKTIEVPLLGSIPVLGRLFKHKSKTPTKSEIIMLIKPTIINTNKELVKGEMEVLNDINEMDIEQKTIFNKKNFEQKDLKDNYYTELEKVKEEIKELDETQETSTEDIKEEKINEENE